MEERIKRSFTYVSPVFQLLILLLFRFVRFKLIRKHKNTIWYSRETFFSLNFFCRSYCPFHSGRALHFDSTFSWTCLGWMENGFIDFLNEKFFFRLPSFGILDVFGVKRETFYNNFHYLFEVWCTIWGGSFVLKFSSILVEEKARKSEVSREL